MAAVRTIGSSVALAAALLLGALMMLPPLAGFERYVITGGSMSGTIERGAVAYARPVPVADLEVGDVITYEPPPGAGPQGMVTHRIVWAGRGGRGARAFRTKGDANPDADPWRFELRGRTQARVAFDVPWVGYPFAALGIRWVRMLVIGVPALVVAFSVLAGLWRSEQAVTA